MILVDEQGDVAGLNGLFKKKAGGSKVGNFLRKNVNLKTAIKLAPMVAAGVATGGVGGAGLALIKKGALKTAGKALIKKVATGAGRKMLIKTAGKALIKKALPFAKVQATRMIANRNGTTTATNEVVVSEPVGNLMPVAPVQSESQGFEAETAQNESEPVGDLTAVKPFETGQGVGNENGATPPPTETKPNYVLYGGIAVGVITLGYFATRKK